MLLPKPNLNICILVDEVVCALLLDVVSVSEQPDDLVSGERQRHEHKQGLVGHEGKKKDTLVQRQEKEIS